MYERSFDLFADFFQFIVRDSEAEWEDLADRWTPETVEAMFVQGRGYVAIGTARNMVVPVTVRIYESEPLVATSRWDRIVHGAIAVPSGELLVTGVTDNGASGGTIQLRPGVYHLRALYAGLGNLSTDGLTGADRYVIELWPTSLEAPAPYAPEFVKA